MKSFKNVREKVKRIGHFTFTIAARSCLDSLDDIAKTATFNCFIFLDALWDSIYSGCLNFEEVFTALGESIYSGYQNWSIMGPRCRFSWWGLKPISEEARWETNSKQNRNQSCKFQKMAVFFFWILLQVFPCWAFFKELRAGGRNQLGPELGKGLAK